MMSVSNQAYVFLATMLAGVIIGFFYDCCRVIRIMIKAGVFVTGILDLLFWVIIGTLSFLVIFYVNDGNVRVFTIMGFVIGWILYVLSISRFVMKVLLWIYETLARVINWLINIILWPFRMLWKAAAYPLAAIKKGLHKLKSALTMKMQSILKKTAKNQIEEKEF